MVLCLTMHRTEIHPTAALKGDKTQFPSTSLTHTPLNYRLLWFFTHTYRFYLLV
jgi:hypothetical protein